MSGVTWTGLDELARLLRTLPAQVEQAAGQVIERSARAHHGAVSASMPAAGADRSGALRRGHRLEQTGPLAWRSRNRAPHAHLYESGFTHVSGRQVQGHEVFVPEAQAVRADMVEQLGEVVGRVATRSGLLTGRA